MSRLCRRLFLWGLFGCLDEVLVLDGVDFWGLGVGGGHGGLFPERWEGGRAWRCGQIRCRKYGRKKRKEILEGKEYWSDLVERVEGAQASN